MLNLGDLFEKRTTQWLKPLSLIRLTSSNEVVGVHSRERDKSFLEFYLDRSSKQQSAKSSAGE